MSLNGLDSPEIKEAHETTLAEAGTWFLLKYASRDEIALLGRGNGGIVEIRNAIANYDEPLFGFTRYWEKSVIIKYVPEGCSRLVQARVTVHLSAIIDRLSPHDTVFSMSSPKELRDTNLSTACFLNTAPSSKSSSAGSRNGRRMIETVEEEEEEKDDEEISGNTEELILSKISDKQLSAEINSSVSDDLSPSLKDSTSPSRTSDTLPPSRNNSDAKSARSEYRKNIQTTSNDHSSYSPSSSCGRYKVKLGPRPSVDVGGRSSPSTNPAYRPVSTLPAGLKPFAKVSRAEREKKSRLQSTTEAPSKTLSSNLLETGSDQLIRPYKSGDRPSTSSGVSIRALSCTTSSENLKMQAKESARSRLQRAQEMRRKKMASETTSSQEIKMVPVGPDLSQMTPPVSPDTLAEIQPVLSLLDEMTRLEDSLFLSSASSNPKTDDSDGTRSESCSMFAIATSEGAGSTKASSISDSIEELVPELAPELSTIASTLVSDYLESQMTTISEVTDDKIESTRSGSFSSLESGLPFLPPTVYKPIKKSSSTPTSSDEMQSLEKQDNLSQENPSIDSTPGSPAQSESSAPMTVESLNALSPELPPADQIRSTENMEGKISNSSVPIEKKCLDVPRSKFSVPRSKFSVPYALEEPPNKFVADKAKNMSSETQSSSKESKTIFRNQSGASKKNIRIDVSVATRNLVESDVNFSSDDEFMDELQTVVFEDARPVSVAKSPHSPITPIIKRNGSDSNLLLRASSNSRSVSPQLATSRTETSKPGDAQGRLTTPQPAASISRKANLGSSISQRIKALERLSAFQEPEIISTLGTTTPAQSFFPVRKSICIGPFNGNSSSRPQSPCSPGLQNRAPGHLLVRNTSPQPLSPSDPSSPRISTPAQISPFLPKDSHDLSDFITCSPRSSPPLINQSQKFPSELDNSTSDKQATDTTPNSPKGRRSSFAVIMDLFNDRQRSLGPETRRTVSLEGASLSSFVKSPSLTTSSMSVREHKRNHSFTSRHSCAEQNLSPLVSTSSLSSSNEDKVDNKGSRTSRILHRMSSSISTGRKTLSQAISPVSPQFEVSHQKEPPMTLGDVNVQFPDTLLWKRKTMLLDSLGYLIIAPIMSTQPNGHTNNKQPVVASRKFPMCEFKMPFTPDLEVEELPNSVILEFLEGGSLQVACENRMNRERTLSILQDAYRKWTVDV